MQIPLGQVENTLSKGNVNSFLWLSATLLPRSEAAAATIWRAGRNGHCARLGDRDLRCGGGCLGIGGGDCAGNCEGDDEAANDDLHIEAPFR